MVAHSIWQTADRKTLHQNISPLPPLFLIPNSSLLIMHYALCTITPPPTNPKLYISNKYK